MRGPKRGPSRVRPRRRSIPSSRSRSSWRELGLDRGGGVQEARLVGDADRLGLVHRRDGDDLDPGLGGELLERGPEHRRSVAEVGAEPDVGTGHAGPERERSAVAADHCAGIAPGCGFRTRTRTRGPVAGP